MLDFVSYSSQSCADYSKDNLSFGLAVNAIRRSSSSLSSLSWTISAKVIDWVSPI